MYHYMQFDPYLIGERNQQIFKEVQALRLERQLRKHNEVRSSRLVTFALRLKSTFHPLRRALAHQVMSKSPGGREVRTRG